MATTGSPLPRTVVTGGMRGIGAATVRRLAGRVPRHEVVAWGRRPPAEAPPWIAALRAGGGTVSTDGAEAADARAVAAAFARADADGAGLTGLVVSAGVWEPTPLAAAPPLDAFRHVIEVNLLGAVTAAAAFLPHLRRGVAGSIVLVGSTAGQRGEPSYSAYAASKAALLGLAKSWAVELAPRGVRVNVVAPGWVDTDMAAPALGDPAVRRAIEAGIPRGRVATADELAGPIAFLLSEDSAHVTGSVLSVNGGGVLASS
jgi:3-oxoacyl-[acyl-carrier protein] reductase